MKITPIRLFLAGLLFLLLLFPRMRQSYQRWNQSQAEKNSLLQAKASLATAPSRIARLQQAQSTTLSGALNFPTLLDSLSRAHSLNIVQLPMEQADGSRLLLQTTLEGSFPNLVAFLDALETSPGPIQVRQASFRTEEIRQGRSLRQYLLLDLQILTNAS